MDYVVNIEAEVPTDPDLAAEQLMDALELEEGDDVVASVHAHPEQRWCLIALLIDADDPFEAEQRAVEMLREAWEAAFADAPATALIVRAFTPELAAERRLVIPEREEIPDEQTEAIAEDAAAMLEEHAN